MDDFMESTFSNQTTNHRDSGRYDEHKRVVDDGRQHQTTITKKL